VFDRRLLIWEFFPINLIASRVAGLRDPGHARRDDAREAAQSLLALEAVDSTHRFYAQLRREAPVVELGSSGVFLSATAALVEQALARTEDLSSHLTGLLLTEDDGEPGVFDMSGVGESSDVLATADDPEHAAHRRVMQPRLALGQVARLQRWLRERERERERSCAQSTTTWRRSRIRCRARRLGY
jgi:cytochrome P450